MLHLEPLLEESDENQFVSFDIISKDAGGTNVENKEPVPSLSKMGIHTKNIETTSQKPKKKAKKRKSKTPHTQNKKNASSVDGNRTNINKTVSDDFNFYDNNEAASLIKNLKINKTKIDQPDMRSDSTAFIQDLNFDENEADKLKLYKNELSAFSKDPNTDTTEIDNLDFDNAFTDEATTFAEKPNTNDTSDEMAFLTLNPNIDIKQADNNNVSDDKTNVFTQELDTNKSEINNLDFNNTFADEITPFTIGPGIKVDKTDDLSADEVAVQASDFGMDVSPVNVEKIDTRDLPTDEVAVQTVDLNMDISPVDIEKINTRDLSTDEIAVQASDLNMDVGPVNVEKIDTRDLSADEIAIQASDLNMDVSPIDIEKINTRDLPTDEVAAFVTDLDLDSDKVKIDTASLKENELSTLVKDLNIDKTVASDVSDLDKNKQTTHRTATLTKNLYNEATDDTTSSEKEKLPSLAKNLDLQIKNNTVNLNENELSTLVKDLNIKETKTESLTLKKDKTATDELARDTSDHFVKKEKNTQHTNESTKPLVKTSDKSTFDISLHKKIKVQKIESKKTYFYDDILADRCTNLDVKLASLENRMNNFFDEIRLTEITQILTNKQKIPTHSAWGYLSDKSKLMLKEVMLFVNKHFKNLSRNNFLKLTDDPKYKKFIQLCKILDISL